MKKWTLVSIILVTALLSSTSFWFGAAEKINLVETTRLNLTPDFFLQNITAIRFNKAGDITERTKALELKHYENDKQSVLLNPRMTTHKSGVTWELKASKGELLDGSQNMILTDDVQATKDPSAENETIVLADLMRYEGEVLIGEGNTSIQSIQGNIKADRITIFINTDKIEIEGSVRGLYETEN